MRHAGDGSGHECTGNGTPYSRGVGAVRGGIASLVHGGIAPGAHRGAAHAAETFDTAYLAFKGATGALKGSLFGLTHGGVGLVPGAMFGANAGVLGGVERLGVGSTALNPADIATFAADQADLVAVLKNIRVRDIFR